MVQRSGAAPQRLAPGYHVDRSDIQGLLLHGYNRQPFARYHLLSFGEGAPRSALTRLIYDISSAEEPPAEHRHNLAFSASGLRALGLSEPELAQFSREFRQGMTHPERALALGDVGPDGAEYWDFAGPDQPPLDALLMSFADSQTRLDEWSAQHERIFERFAITWQARDAHRLGPASERGNVREPATPRRQRVARGEFVLGERDTLGERHAGPFVAPKSSLRELPGWCERERALDFGRNGSYLVVRKLELNGEPLRSVLFEEPSRSKAHRLLRRIRHDDAGMWFMAFNADIRRQFEFLAHRLPPRVRVRGGAYLFLPSVRGLHYLAEPGV